MNVPGVDHRLSYWYRGGLAFSTIVLAGSALLAIFSEKGSAGRNFGIASSVISTPCFIAFAVATLIDWRQRRAERREEIPLLPEGQTLL